MSTIVTKVVNNVDCHALKLFRNVTNLFNVDNINNPFSDVQIKVGNRTFYCHKLILSLASEYFTNLSFQCGSATLQSINPDHFYDVLQFIYTGEVLVSTNNIKSLLSAADILGMEDLTLICYRFLDYCIKSIESRINLTTLCLKLKQIYQKTAARYFQKIQSSSRLHCCTTEIFMKVILSDDNLEVNTEVEVCEMLMTWLQVQTDAGHEVHLDKLLPLIRWSGISVDYVKSKLLPNTTLTLDSASVNFLTKVISYLLSGVQFEGLQTFHRPSTGLESCLISVGLWNGNTVSKEVYHISLQRRGTVTKSNEFPVTISNMAAACSFNNTVYVVGTGDAPYKEMWKWKPATGWRRCADMPTGRGYHSVVALDSCLYVLGGMKDSTSIASVESYNMNTKKWTQREELIHAVRSAACVAYQKYIYVFGGRNCWREKHKTVDYVQAYNATQDCCTVLNKPMPRAHYAMRAMLWETNVILMDNSNCYIYNFETQTWQERKQFKADEDYFGLALHNETVFIAGGLCNIRDEQNKHKQIQTCINDIRSVSILDIINDKSAVWKHHAQLPKPAMIFTFATVSVPFMK